MSITTRSSRWKIGGPEQAVPEHTFHETNGLPSVTERSSPACLLKSERRVQVWFQNHRQHGMFAEDTKTIASLSMNTIILLCIYTRLRPDVPYDSMARHVSNVLTTAGDQADALVRHHTYTFIVMEARRIQSDTVDKDDAVYIATTGLIMRVANVLGVIC